MPSRADLQVGPCKAYADAVDRRLFLSASGATLVTEIFPEFFTRRGLYAQELVQTPALTEGPFYPDRFPLDTDNDLLVINDSITPAVGDVTYLSGRVLGALGGPVRNAVVEIWQVDSTASYIHTQGRNPKGFDRNFQGYGRFLTDARGQYYFRTIRPITYTLNSDFRAPHIHVAVSMNGKRVLTTQFGINGHKDNNADPVFRGLSQAGHESVLVDFRPVRGSRIGELTANFDVVLGRNVA